MKQPAITIDEDTAQIHGQNASVHYSIFGGSIDIYDDNERLTDSEYLQACQQLLKIIEEGEK